MPSPFSRLGGPRGFLTDEEKENKPKITKELFFRILFYLKPYRLQLIIVFIAIFISAAIGLLPSVIMGRIVDEALIGKDMGLLLALLGAALGALVVSQLLQTFESYINAWISQSIIFDMKNQMYKHLQNMPHSFFSSEKQGEIITRMSNDIGGVSTVISGTLTSFASNLFIVITTIIALFTMNWQLALVGIVVIPLLILPAKETGKTRWKLLAQNQKIHDEMNDQINETLSISGSMLVKLFTREKKEYERFVKVNDSVRRVSMKEQRSGKIFQMMMGMFTQIGPLLIYFAGGYFIISRMDTSLTIGEIAATVALITRLYRPVQGLLNIQVEFTRSMALFTRIFDYFDRKTDITSKPDAVRPDFTNAPISFSDVCFSYKPGEPVLKNVTFHVSEGSMLAIVGPSGSGKSTIVNLIPRLYDVTGGSVTIAGNDVRDIDLHYLRASVGVVTQDTYLFNGTIKENLLYAKDDATDEEIENACRIANMHDFIVSRPDKYETVVGNRGLMLSGGEKQRISIARVILKNPKILILDEATSSLDSISENSIQDALQVLMKGRTSIVIAHRLSTVLAADNILVVNAGRVAEEGTHNELMGRGGVYTELYETQFSKVLEYESAQGQSDGSL